MVTWCGVIWCYIKGHDWQLRMWRRVGHIYLHHLHICVFTNKNRKRGCKHKDVLHLKLNQGSFVFWMLYCRKYMKRVIFLFSLVLLTDGMRTEAFSMTRPETSASCLDRAAARWHSSFLTSPLVSRQQKIWGGLEATSGSSIKCSLCEVEFLKGNI